MSLESLLQENTAALQAQTDAIHKLVTALAAGALNDTRKVVGMTKSMPEVAEKPATVTIVETAQAEEAVVSEVKATYEEAAKAVTQLAKNKKREAAVAVLQQFGAATLKDVKPEDFAAVIDACNKAEAEAA